MFNKSLVGLWGCIVSNWIKMNFRADMFLQHWNTDFNRRVQNDNMLLRNTALMIDGM